MKGIAITLATREDGEAVAGIEKLTGIKLPRTDSEAAPAAAPAEEAVPQDERPAKTRGGRSRGRSKERAERPERVAKAPAAPAEQEMADEVEEFAPTAEPAKAGDVAGAWNGPVPSFLQFGAA
jgi:hypothetical protein